MFFELLGHCVAHPSAIRNVAIIRAFRLLRESGELAQEPDFETRQYELIAEHFNVDQETVKGVVDCLMQRRPLKYVRLFRDRRLLRLLGELRREGAKIAVYSDYPADRKIEALAPFKVDYCFCATDKRIMCLKPDSTGLKEIVETLGEPIENFLFIGDRYEKDGKCAENIGMDYLILGKCPLSRKIQLSNATALPMQ
jgi:HAD superfamily hydrolase (TIGR01549 family)